MKDDKVEEMTARRAMPMTIRTSERLKYETKLYKLLVCMTITSNVCAVQWTNLEKESKRNYFILLTG